jgi:hypothetical protein
MAQETIFDFPLRVIRDISQQHPPRAICHCSPVARVIEGVQLEGHVCRQANPQPKSISDCEAWADSEELHHGWRFHP